MSIEVDKERLITFAQLAKALPPRRGGRPVHPSTICRWRHPGLAGVRLEAVRVGGAWHTTWEAFARFCDQLTSLAGSGSTRAATTASRRAAQQQVSSVLDGEGW
jgi:hypothetical protein